MDLNFMFTLFICPAHLVVRITPLFPTHHIIYWIGDILNMCFTVTFEALSNKTMSYAVLCTVKGTYLHIVILLKVYIYNI